MAEGALTVGPPSARALQVHWRNYQLTWEKGSRARRYFFLAVHFFQLSLQHCCLIRIANLLLLPPLSPFLPPPLLFLSQFIASLLFNTTPKPLPHQHTITHHTSLTHAHIHTVTLSPSLEQLAYQAYLAVAQQLPSLLRQWYLSVDRQTSTMVNK